MGGKFALIRFIMNIFGILFFAYRMNKFLSEEKIQAIYENTETVDQI